MKKSQVAMEFIIMLGIAFFIFFIFLGIFLNKQVEFNKERELILVSDLAFKLQEEINLAAKVEDGYMREFVVTPTLEGIDFDIKVWNNELIVNSSKQEITVLIPNIIGNISKGTNRINKTNGVIYVSQ